VSSDLPRIGIRLPFQGLVSAKEIMAVAKAADEAGFDSGWVGEHILFPGAIESPNPSTRTGVYPTSSSTPIHDAFGVLCVAATASERLGLAIGCAIAAYRPAAMTAKLASTVDWFSDGRAILGVANGWLREEFGALGVPFRERTKRLEETIEVCRLLWTDPSPSYEGRFSSFGPSYFEPKPPQGLIPIIVGGHSEPALRRAGRVGDGWFGTTVRADEIPAMRAVMDEGRAVGGREGKPFTVYASWYVSPDPELEAISPDHIDLRDKSRAREAFHEYAVGGTDVLVVKTFDQSAKTLCATVDAVMEIL
jgi:probable F420-dependent oxidoreductase